MLKNIAVFFGGQSTEHDISIITAISSIIKPLKMTNEYNVIPIYISKDGKWYSDEIFSDIKSYQNGEIEKYISKNKPISLSFNDGLKIIKPAIRQTIINIDIAFPAMHGLNGEDGSLMGLLRMANIPFVGCDMAAAAIAMDKAFSKQIAVQNGIKTPEFIDFYKNDYENNSDKIVSNIEKNLEYPLFIKPVHLGSSIGINRATNRDELVNSIEVALYYDEKIIVEQSVENLIEVTIPVIGNEEPEVALVERPLTNKDEFFDFETKYMNGGKKSGSKTGSNSKYSELPAKLNDDLYNECIIVAKNVYRAIGCEGISRVDLLIDSKTNEVYFNEINPLPGSLYAHNWRANGISNVELVKKLIDLALQKFEKNKSKQTTFDSSFLKQF